MVNEFHRSQNPGRHITFSGSFSLSESETKKRKIDELIGQLLHYDSSVTAYSLLQALKQMEKTDKVCLHSAHLFVLHIFLKCHLPK